MQPTSGSPQYPPQSGYAALNEPAGRPGFAPAPPEASIVRVRAWLTGTVAAVTVLVLIAAIANQGVSDQIVKHANDTRNFFDNAARATTVYSWRFSPQLSTDFGHIWIAGILCDVLVVVLTLLITTALAKNKRGFGGTFLAAWVAVIVATQAAAYLRATIVDVNQIQGQGLGKPVAIFFSPYSPGAYSAFVGVLFGLVVALIAGAVGAASRRTEVLAAPAPMYLPEPSEEQPVRRENQQAWTAPPPPGPISSPSPWTDRVDTTKRDEPQSTAVLPVVDQPERRDTSDSQATTQFPAWPPRSDRTASEPESATESTQAYRVPIDEDGEPDATQAYRLPREDEDPPRSS